MDSSAASKPKVFVLCFDGTGNKFSGTDADSNILKIYRMLDRSEGDQFHYYQPGIGTYVTTTSLDHTSVVTRFKSWYDKAKDSAVGTSFANHVMGGYRFLMRYYTPGDDIYFFGFSRGAYTARFLAEMLDHVGLLSAGNEELSRFAWKTFSKWQARRGGDSAEEKQKEAAMYTFMRNFRETFSRPVRRIRFLGLFDTVNSVPRFESAFMQRSKFPYTARSSAKVIRHAVSINERRAKFRQDLLTSSQLDRQDRNLTQIHRYASELPHMMHQAEKGGNVHVNGTAGLTASQPTPGPAHTAEHDESTLPTINVGDEATDDLAGPVETQSTEDLQQFEDAPEKPHARDHRRPHAQQHPHPENGQPQTSNVLSLPRPDIRRSSMTGPVMTRSTEDLQDGSSFPHPHSPNYGFQRRYSDSSKHQDILELWFPGSHGDIGGGWTRLEGEPPYALAHNALVWMVHEAQLAGLKFDARKLVELNCTPNLPDPTDAKAQQEQQQRFHDALLQSQTRGVSHDVLERHGGLSFGGWAGWWVMEYLPFRRMDLRPDGSWSAIRWPLPAGEVRDIPDDAKIHCSAIKRMQEDEKYRPGNLIIGGGGRGVRVASKKYGMGEWEVWKNEGDPVTEVYVRKKRERPSHDKQAS